MHRFHHLLRASVCLFVCRVFVFRVCCTCMSHLLVHLLSASSTSPSFLSLTLHVSLLFAVLLISVPLSRSRNPFLFDLGTARQTILQTMTTMREGTHTNTQTSCD